MPASKAKAAALSPVERVMAFMAKQNIPVRDENVVTTGIQDSCEMATVEVNGACVMMGNFWDFHPECHGLNLPAFGSHESLANLFVMALKAAGKQVKQKTNRRWRYA